MREFPVLKTAVGLLMTAVFAWLVIRQVDLPGLREALRGASAGWLALALLFLAFDYVLRIVRWWLMLRSLDQGIRVSACVRPYLASIALNNLLPLRAGDAARVLAFRAQLRAGAMRLLGTLVIERLLDLASVLLILFVALRLVGAGELPPYLLQASAGLGVATAAALVLLPLFGPWIASRVHVDAGKGDVGAGGMMTKLRQHGVQLLDALSLLRTRRLAAGMLGVSLLIWLLEGGVFVCSALALDLQGIAAAFLALGAATLATLIPSSPGYVGTFDFFAMSAMQAGGADSASAAAFALLVHVLLWLPLTVVGALCLLVPAPALPEAAGPGDGPP